MRSTLSMALVGLALTLAGASRSNAADPTLTLTGLPVINLQAGGKGVTPNGAFVMNGQGLNKISIQQKNALGKWVDLVVPVGMIQANTWQIPMNMAIPVTVGVTYTYRAVMEWTDIGTGQKGPPVYSAEKSVTP